jgi:hypothetical protein
MAMIRDIIGIVGIGLLATDVAAGPRPGLAADTSIGLVRPEGPLGSLWPSSLRTGPDGTLILRGLEAGRHTILVGEEKQRREVAIPAADGAEAEPVVVRLVAPRS